MSHVGQCPSCHTRYELEAADVGHLLECGCGEVLFACNASSLPVIPVRCDSCGETYEVDGSDAGQPVECECGKTLVVPTVVFRLPIGTGEAAAAAISSANEDDEELGDEDSDAVETVGIANDTAGNGEAAAGGIVVTSEDDSHPNRDQSDRSRSSRPKGESQSKSSLATWLGVAAVVVFLLFAVGMFVMREPPSKAKAKVASAEDAGTEADSPVSNVDPPPARGAESKADPALVAEVASLGTSVTAATSVTAPVATASKQAEAKEEVRYPIMTSTLYALPKPTKAKTRVPVSTERVPRMTLNSGVPKAFDAYEATQKLQTAAESSGVAADVEAYHQSLGKTLAVIEYVHRLAMEESDQKQINSMRYLLAYLYYAAGHLPEACVLGEAVARWGDKEEPATKEAAMIALAASQELSEAQWGKSEMVGELTEMESIVSVLAKRWPDDPQLDLIWMNLAYLYEAFNYPSKAIAIYQKLAAGSPQYGDAQIASGMARWGILRRSELSDRTKFDREELKIARQELVRGLRKKEKDDALLTPTVVDVRLALAQMDLLLGENERAEQWLIESPPSLIESVSVNETEEAESIVVVDEPVARQVFDVWFFIRQQAGDAEGATDVLSKMSEVVESSVEQVEARRMSIMKRTVDQLKTAANVTRADVEQLEKLSAKLLAEESSVPTANLLWLGESWSEIGHRARNPEVAKDCAAAAADLYGKAMLRTDFPANSEQTAQLRRIELLRRSGKVLESLKLIEEVLAKTPNVFSLQIEAAESLQQLALDSGRASDLTAAMKGPEGFSSIWGWGKLVTSLHAARWS
ncbi:MAG: hypothetical protein ACR2NZ_02880, partial [Rubripirellula sp.]